MVGVSYLQLESLKRGAPGTVSGSLFVTIGCCARCDSRRFQVYRIMAKLSGTISSIVFLKMFLYGLIIGFVGLLVFCKRYFPGILVG